MKTSLYTFFALCLSSFMMVGSANAAYSSNMPFPIFQDCLVVEGAGSSFPNKTYAYKREYEEWRASKAVEVKSTSGEVPDSIKSVIAAKE